MSYLPQVEVQVDGRPLPRERAEALGGVRVMQGLSLPALCELTFREPRDAVLGQRDPLVPGASLRVTVNAGGPPLFTGEVTAVELEYGPARQREVRVRGYDRLHRLRKRQPVRSHAQLTLPELARELVSDLGVSVEVGAAGPAFERLVQHHQTDLELLTEVAGRCGIYLTLREQVLHLLTLEGIGPAIPLVAGDSLLETRLEVNADPACRSVEAQGWDPWWAEPHAAVADSARVGREVEVDAPPRRVGGEDRRTLVDEAVQSDAQASGLAQAALDRRVASEVTLWGIAEGDPELRPGARTQVADVADALCGRYVVAKATHTIDRERGYVTEIDTTPPIARPRPRGSVTTLGVVTQVEDPEGHGRVRVSLPSYDGLETDWLEVLTPGAGPDKGLIALPDVDDRVLVLMARGDPAQALVAGGLYGREGPPDAGVKEGAVRRYTFVTPGGQRIQLDDARKSVRVENEGGNRMLLSPGRARLENGHGSFVELTGKALRVHAETDLLIEAPGRSVTIRGGKIDFERG